MLSVNRYRVRHRAELGQRAAKVLEQLLKRPDDWLGINLVILAAASVFASQAATVLAERSGLSYALSVTGIGLTIVMIIFGELVPKIFAAAHSETVALRSAFIYRTLVAGARPVLWLTSHAAYGVLRLLGGVGRMRDPTLLSPEELRAVVAEATPLISARHRQMLLAVLDLGRVTVDDIMVPRQEIDGIDIAADWDEVMEKLRQTPHTRLPVFDGDLDNLIGMLHMKRVARELARNTLTRARLAELAALRPPYFVPERTTLAVQLQNFQRDRRRHAFVINEYGDVEGLATLEDILEEIVGEFTSDPVTVSHKDIHTETPGVFVVNASMTLRALNRALQWHLPIDGPKTVNGLLLEHLETIPDPGTTVRVDGYQFEVLKIADNAVRTVRIRAN